MRLVNFGENSRPSYQNSREFGATPGTFPLMVPKIVDINFKLFKRYTISLSVKVNVITDWGAPNIFLPGGEDFCRNNLGGRGQLISGTI